jgi:chaperonin GroL
MRQNRLVRLDAGAREEILRGASVLASAVRVTMGPRGRNVIIGRSDGPPILTKDGVTVAKAVNLADPFQDLGVQSIKEAAARTAEDAGDGTTGATVLAHAMLQHGVMLLAAGYTAADLKAGIDLATDRVVAELSRMAVPVGEEQVSQVGTISANGEVQIGEMIARAFSLVGRDGVVSVEEARTFSSSLEHVEGAQIDRGYLSPYFINNQEKSTCDLERPLVLLTNRRIASLREVLPVLEKVAAQKRSLLIIADDVEGDAMQGLVLNHSRGTIQVCAIKAPGFGHGRVDSLADLAALLKCRVADGEGDFSKVGVEAEIVSYEWGESLERSKAKDRDGALLLGWTGDNGDPDNFFFLLGCAGGTPAGQNISKWCNKEFDDLLMSARTLTDVKERSALYAKMQEISKAEAPQVTIAHSTVFEPVRKEVEGDKVSPLGRHEFTGVSMK